MGSDYQLNDEGMGGEDFIIATVMRLNWAKKVDRIGTCKKEDFSVRRGTSFS